MYLFIDESKQINHNNWKFIFWWLITNYKPSTLDKIYYQYLKDNWIKEKWWEIKSFDNKYRSKISSFYQYLKENNHLLNIEFVWLFATWYRENWKNYYNSLIELVYHTILYNNLFNNSFKDIKIIADNLKLDINEENIRNMLNNEEKILKVRNIGKIKKFSFTFSNSKRYWWLKFSDFIAWILRDKYILGKKELPFWFIETFVNKEIIFIKLE